MRAWALALLGGLTGCGDSTPDLPDGGGPVCPTHDQARFELGTGELAFQPLQDEDRLTITAGPQGGCHFFLSLLTDGFAERRFQVEYDVLRADTGETTESYGVFTVRLDQAPDAPGKCQAVGITAFLIQPWRFEGERVRVVVKATDDEGRSFTQEKTVIADWPATLPENACGFRGS